jgi:hypothetical protein
MKSEHCLSSDRRKHWKCEQGGCDCKCHECIVYEFGKEGNLAVQTIKRRTRKLSPRGNWIVIVYHNGEIFWAKWIQTWAGVQASKRNPERYIEQASKTYKDFKGRVIVLDIERMVDFAATEGANEIADLERLMGLTENEL